MNWKIATGIIALLLLVGGGSYYLGQKYNVVLTPHTPIPTQTLVGNDRDAHGCIGSAGYSWCEIKQKCVRPWEEPCESAPTPTQAPTAGQGLTESAAKQGEALAGASKALADKYGADTIQSTSLSAISGRFAKGMVNFKGGGGIWFAAEDINTGKWNLIYDGNGIIPCNVVPKDFPNTLIPKCVSGTELVTR